MIRIWGNRHRGILALYVRPVLDVVDGTLQRTRQVNMEQGPVEAVHNNRFPVAESDILPLRRLEDLRILTATLTRSSFDVIGAGPRERTPKRLFIELIISGLRGTVGATNLGNGEDALPPAMETIGTLGGVPKTG